MTNQQVLYRGFSPDPGRQATWQANSWEISSPFWQQVLTKWRGRSQKDGDQGPQATEEEITVPVVEKAATVAQEGALRQIEQYFDRSDLKGVPS